MNAIIHIGSPKTGTSTIQRFLHKNHESLREQGVFTTTSVAWDGGRNYELRAAAVNPDLWKSYPFFSFCGYGSFLALLKKEFSEKDQYALWDKYRRELTINCLKDDLVLFSDEELIFLDEREIEIVKGLMDFLFEDVTIILYLRRQPEYLVSYHNTLAIIGSPWSIFDYLNIPEGRSFMAYHKIVHNWSVFGKGKIKIRVFDKQALHEGDLLSDFALTSGFDITKLEHPENENTSLGSAETEYLRLLNAHIPTMLDSWTYNSDRSFIGHFFRQSIWKNNDKAYYLNRSEAQRIIDQYREGNDWIAREYLGREKLFSEDVSMYPEEVASPHDLTLEKCAEITASLWKERCGIIQQLEGKINTLTEKSVSIDLLQQLQNENQELVTEVQRLLGRRNKRLLYRCKSLLTWLKKRVTQITVDVNRPPLPD